MKAIFQPFVSMVWALGSTHPATVTKENGDGTVNLIAHDGHDTPHENVPFYHPDGDVPPAGGFFAVPAPDEVGDENAAPAGDNPLRGVIENAGGA